MKTHNLGYSQKNIPTPSKPAYLKCLISKVESLLRRVRWKVFFWENRDKSFDKKESYGFNSENAPPQNEALEEFENAMYDLISNIEFNNKSNAFQRSLKRDILKISKSKDLFVPADKTTNLYAMPPDDYKKLLAENVTKTYKKAEPGAKRAIDREARDIAADLQLSDRIEQMAPNPAFVTIKDHKENFQNDTKCRLLNPAKSEIGVISRHHLQGINAEIRATAMFNQWRSTGAVLDWFNAANKVKKKFLIFDVEEFYPSITEELLDAAISWARTKITISDDIVSIIKHARKSLLFHDGDEWVKKSGDLFDVTMGSYDGAEVCELVGLYILDQMKTSFPELDTGIYRDDGLSMYPEMSGPRTDKLRKDLIKFFQQNKLKITITMNMDQVDFLDVTLRLSDGKFWPYRKPNDTPLYIHAKSNHPPNIKKQLPAMISRRISDLSCDETQFGEHKGIYDTALRNSGFAEKTTYQKKEAPKQRQRTREIIWFNPPFSESVDTNLGKKYLAIVSKCFPKSHKYSSFLNRHTLKLSYSCMPNLKAIIAGHNKKILAAQQDNAQAKLCNCRDKSACPVGNNCLKSAVIYRATVTSNGDTKEYVGLAETTFKARFTNHKSDLTHKDKGTTKGTTLSKHVWSLKAADTPHTLKWELCRQSSPYKCGTRSCDLCLSEKLEILTSKTGLLNKRSEIFNKCRHSRKFKLCAVT